jgi:signal transduction histidine kinase
MTVKTQSSQLMNRFPLIWLLVGMTIALVAALALLTVIINPPQEDLIQLFMFMGGSGIGTILLSYLFFRTGLYTQFPSLRWSLVSIVVITVLLTLLNIWVTAQLMFLSEHDLALTVSLLIFAGLTAVIFGIYIAGTITARIMNLSDAAQHIAKGKLDTRLVVNGNDELAEFAHTFNWMAETLEVADEEKQRVENARRNLIAWVSHDLRTPLTSMQAMLEAIQDEIVTDPATINEYVGRSLSEVTNLSHLIDDLFELSKLDTGHMDAKFVSASITDLISDVVSNLMAKAERKQIKLNGKIEPNIPPIMMATDKIQRVLYNLIDNAVQYTPIDGEITIKASIKGKFVRVDIHNTGKPIGAHHLPKIFNHFYRVEESRTQSMDGHRSTGLGLAIAKAIVEMHDGKIGVTSEPNKGTTFRFKLPLNTIEK